MRIEDTRGNNILSDPSFDGFDFGESEHETTNKGIEMSNELVLVGYLPIGQPNTNGDKIGPGFQPRTPGEVDAIINAARNETRPFTISNAAFCIDEREIVQLGNITNPDILRKIVAPRLPGGTGLASTKAALAANAVIVRDAKTFPEAYNRVTGVLSRAGIKDAGHKGCGAEVEAGTSVKHQVDFETSFVLSRTLGIAQDGEEQAIRILHENKTRRASDRFWDTYNPDFHRERVLATAPEYYAILKTEHDKVHGHHGSGLYVTQGDEGLPNGFAEQWNHMLFVYTHAFARQLSRILGGSEEERRLIELAFVDDLIDVGNVLFAKPEGDPGDPNYYPGMAVFEQMLSR